MSAEHPAAINEWRIDFIHRSIGSCISETVKAASRPDAVRLAQEQAGEGWEPYEAHLVEVDEDGTRWVSQSWRIPVSDAAQTPEPETKLLSMIAWCCDVACKHTDDPVLPCSFRVRFEGEYEIEVELDPEKGATFAELQQALQSAIGYTGIEIIDVIEYEMVP
jgi:hypothetical protein